MNILFLDFDGVIVIQRRFSQSRPIETLIDNIKAVLQATNAKIVVSSTWRCCDPPAVLEKIVTHDFGFSKDIYLGSTDPQIWDRAEAINAWLKDHPDINSFVIVDDDPANEFGPFPELSKRLVQTKTHIGFSKDLVPHAIQILSLPHLTVR